MHHRIALAKSLRHFLQGSCLCLCLSAGLIGAETPPPAEKLVPKLAVAYPFETLETNLPPIILQKKLQTDPLLALGFLDVTLYGADATGKIDSTAAIQNAMDDGYFYGYVCYFPAGTYLVSDTLCGMQRSWKHEDNPYWHLSRRKAHLLMGEKGKRPTIKLADRAAGFDDPRHVKAVLQMWSQPQPESSRVPSTRIEDEQGSSQINQKVRGLNFDLSGAGHRGAVAIRMNGAQGSTIEDVSINASGAFAGLFNLPGHGGGVFNIEVTGGRHAVYIEKKGYTCIAGARFIGQTDLVLFDFHPSPLTMVGFLVEKSSGPAFRPNPKNQTWIPGGLSLVDGVIQLQKTGKAIDNPVPNMLTVNNVRCLNADVLVGQDAAGDIKGSGKPDVWDLIDEYASCWRGTFWAGEKKSFSITNGKIHRDTISRITRGAGPPAADPRVRHVWNEADFPGFRDADAVNIKTLGARGDGVHDDTSAIERAIAFHKKIFFPRGIYLVNRTLLLKKDTQLIGAAPINTIIQADARTWKPTAETTIIATEDASDGTAVLADIDIRVPTRDGESVYFNCLHWRAGRASLIRDVTFSDLYWLRQPVACDFRLIKITGNGGGRWYGIYCFPFGRYSLHPDYRHILVSGTREPLAFYALECERAQGRAQAEIRHSENVSIYLLKSEHNHVPLLINSSKKIRVYGYGGPASPLPGLALFEVIDSRDVRIINICPTNLKPRDAPYGVLQPRDPGTGVNVDPALDFLVQEDYFNARTQVSRIHTLSQFSRD
jgi:hypothetical protein